MTGDRVQIDSLQLNIPGLTRDEADRLGKDVLAWMEGHLALQMPNRNLKTLNLRVHLSDSTPKNQLAEMIAKQICKSLT
jgi:hypothetical protein